MASSGDPRVLWAMNFVLSFAFSTAVLGGLDFIGLVPFEWGRVAVATVVLMLVSYVVALR